MPYSVSITEVPLITIADRLEAQLRTQHDALEQCCDSLADLNNTISLARQDLRNLEFHYSLAREEANVHALASDENEGRLRISFLREELVRVYNDKERILRKSRESSDEIHQLRERLVDMAKIKEENHHLRRSNARLQLRHEDMRKQLDEANKQVKALKGEPQSTLSLLRKLCASSMSSEDVQGKQICNHRRRDSRISFY